MLRDISDKNEKLSILIQLVLVAISIHSIAGGNLYEQIVSVLAETFIDIVGIPLLKDKKKEVLKEFLELLKDADNKMKINASYASIKNIWKDKSVEIVDKLSKADISNITYEKCYIIIQEVMKLKSDFEYQEYTDNDYNNVGKLFFKYLLDVHKSNSDLPTALAINSINEIYIKLQELEKCIDKQKIDNGKVILISKESRRHRNSFYRESREAEINYIKEILDKNDRVCLISGIGGIGKTELCKYLFHAYRNRYISSDILYIGWITYTGNMIQTLYEQIECNKDKIDILKGYEETCAYLNGFGNELMLFVDNIDQTAIYDKEIQFLLGLNCKIIITSRINVFDTIPAYSLKPISEFWCEKLFYTFYLGKKDDSALKNILSLTSCHTLAIELIAKTAQSTGASISEMAEMLSKVGFSLPDIKNKVWHDKDEEVLIEHFKKLYNLVSLKEKYKNALYRMACWPTKEYKIERLLQLKIFNSREDIELLGIRGWINFDGRKVFLHPVISEAIYYSSTNRYQTYKRMYGAITESLELNKKSIFAEKYFLMKDCIYVSEKKKFEYIEYAEMLNQIAVILNRSGQPKKAYGIQKEAIRIKKKIKVSEEQLFTVYNNMALLCKNIGLLNKDNRKLKEAVKWCEEAEAIGNNLYIQSPLKYAIKYATTLNNLGLCYFNVEMFDKAKCSILRSIKIKKEYLGENSIELGQSYNNLSLIYKKEGLKGHPKKIKWAYKIQLKAVDNKDDIDYPIHLYNLASIEYLLKEFDVSMKHINEVINIWLENEEIYMDKLDKARKLKLKIEDEMSDVREEWGN